MEEENIHRVEGAEAASPASITPQIRESHTTYQLFRCSNPRCNALDQAKLMLGEFMPRNQRINCWRCRSGSQVPLEQMIAEGLGMERIGEPASEPFNLNPPPPSKPTAVPTKSSH